MIESGKIKQPGYLWRKLKDRVETLAIMPANGSTTIVGRKGNPVSMNGLHPVTRDLWCNLPDYDVEPCAQVTGGNIDTEEIIHGLKLHVCSYRRTVRREQIRKSGRSLAPNHGTPLDIEWTWEVG